jgi:hypothetical protein
MRDGSKVQLTESPTLLSSSRTDKVEYIHEVFNYVSAKTFKDRWTRYTDQLATSHFFDYSGWRFFPQDKKIVNLATQRAYSTQSVELLKSYGFLEVREKERGLAAKVGHHFGTPVGIGTIADTDVFFALLEKLFGISWA